MENLTLISLLEKQIKEEINRLSHSPNLNLEKEQARFKVYEALTKEISENHG